MQAVRSQQKIFEKTREADLKHKQQAGSKPAEGSDKVMSQQQQQSAKRFSLIFLSILCLALLGFAWMTNSRADTTTSSLSTDSDGTYLIATSKDPAIFRDHVNSGSSDISARLTADIDLEGRETNQWKPSGSGAAWAAVRDDEKEKVIQVHKYI